MIGIYLAGCFGAWMALDDDKTLKWWQLLFLIVMWPGLLVYAQIKKLMEE